MIQFNKFKESVRVCSWMAKRPQKFALPALRMIKCRFATALERH